MQAFSSAKTGVQFIRDALETYLLLDLTEEGLPSFSAYLRGGFVEEGRLSEATPTPAAYLAFAGDGEIQPGVYALRFILYVVEKGRGYAAIDAALDAARLRLAREDLLFDFFSLPSSPRVLGVRVSGALSSSAISSWKAEGKGIVILVYVSY